MSAPIAVDWAAILKKYANSNIPADVRGDIGLLIAYARERDSQIRVMKEELIGAKKTMLALSRAVGTIEIPFALIDLLDDRDQLHVTDVNRAGELCKQFSYVQFAPFVH